MSTTGLVQAAQEHGLSVHLTGFHRTLDDMLSIARAEGVAAG